VRISFSRTGGFAGIRLAAAFESGTLSPAVEQDVRQLAFHAHFFDLPGELQSRSPGADRFSYQVSIEDGEHRHAVRISEAAAPPELRALLKFLTDLAVQHARSAPAHH
jgi:hypothetical protein